MVVKVVPPADTTSHRTRHANERVSCFDSVPHSPTAVILTFIIQVRTVDLK